VLVPGDPERLARERRAREGVEVDAVTWAELVAAAEQLGVTRTALDAIGP
jgi:uncharacterized oxidoreductase